MNRNYELGDIIYKNINSKIQKAKINGKNIIIKRLNLEDESNHKIDLTLMDRIDREVKIIRQLDHPNLMTINDNFVRDSEVWLIMDQMDFTLIELIPITDSKLISSYLYFILSGLTYLHQQNIIHRDIKSANILVSKNGSVKVTDFGVSRLEIKEPMSFVGTPYWMSPEMIENKGVYNRKTDIWSLGITLVEMYFGSPPYAADKPMKAMVKIYNDKSPIPEKYEIPIKQLRDLIKVCLHKDPTKRPDANIILKHKFIGKLKIEKRQQYIKDCLEKDKIKIETRQQNIKDHLENILR